MSYKGNRERGNGYRRVYGAEREGAGKLRIFAAGGVVRTAERVRGAEVPEVGGERGG